MKKVLINNWARIVISFVYATMVLALALELYGIPIRSRLNVHDEINIGTPVLNFAFFFGMSYENWEYPNYLLAILNGVDGLLGALISVITDDWRTAKLIQYSAALICVFAGFWYALGKLLEAPSTNNKLELDALKVVITTCYVFSPYAFTQMNNGTFWSFTVYFAIAFVPFLLLALLKTITWNDSSQWRNKGFGFGLFVGVCCWWLPLIAVILCSIFLAWALSISFKRNQIDPIEARSSKLSLIAGLLVGLLPVFIASYFTLVSPGIEVDFKFLEYATYGIIQGGILTPFLQRFSWILYIGWEQKAVHSYFEDFDVLWVRILYLANIALLIYAALKIRDRSLYWRLFVGFLLVYLSAIFFAKGASFPFGSFFVSLVDFVPGFGVIRTPDTKFGMVVTASLLLALVLAGAMNKFVLRAMLALGVAYLGAAIPLWWSGELINPSGNARYTMSLSPDEERAINYLNSTAGEGRVLMFPGSGGGVYAYRGYSYVGRNYLTGNINRQVVSAQAGIVGERNSIEMAREFLEKMDFISLKEMGIQFVLINKTIELNQYRKFNAKNDNLSLRTILDGKRVALFELIGSGKPFEVVDAAGKEINAAIYRSKTLPVGFIVSISGYGSTQMPLRIRADVVASNHWIWLPLSEGDGYLMGALRAVLDGVTGRRQVVVSETRPSRVGLAEWIVTRNPGIEMKPVNKRWAVIHMPNLALSLSMLLCALLGSVLLVKRLLLAIIAKLRLTRSITIG